MVSSRRPAFFPQLARLFAGSPCLSRYLSALEARFAINGAIKFVGEDYLLFDCSHLVVETCYKNHHLEYVSVGYLNRLTNGHRGQYEFKLHFISDKPR